MEYIILIPIFVVLVYGVYLINSYKRFHQIILISSLILMLVMEYIILLQFLSLSLSLFSMLITVVMVLFIVSRLQNKVHILYVLLFIITNSLFFFVVIQFENSYLYVSFIVMLFFLLSENNQLFMRKTYEEGIKEYQNKILSNQIDEVKNIYMTMRGWRHDYHNHLQKMKAHMSLNQIEEANNYLDELELDLDNVNQLVETGNLSLDAILNSKLSLAQKNNITLNYKASVPDNLTISDIDLCVLIGNLIDNAVEACIKIEDLDETFIRLYIGIFKKQLYISVSNSTNDHIKKLDEEYITNKRGNHGHGLKRISNIVEKYNGFINRQNEPSVFVTEVLLPL